MSKAYVTCTLLPGKVQNEKIYCVRQVDGTILEGYCGLYTSQVRASIWGTVTVMVLGESNDQTEVLLPDGQKATVMSAHVSKE